MPYAIVIDDRDNPRALIYGTRTQAEAAALDLDEGTAYFVAEAELTSLSRADLEAVRPNDPDNVGATELQERARRTTA